MAFIEQVVMVSGSLLVLWFLSRREWGGLLPVLSVFSVCLPFGSILLLVLFLNELWRTLVSLLLWLEHSGEIYLMGSGADGFWAFQSPADPSTYTTVYVLEGRPDLEKIRRQYVQNVVGLELEGGVCPFQKLTRSIVKRYGYYCWKEHYGRDFDIQNHVKYGEGLGAGAEEIVTETDLRVRMAGFTNELMDSRFPPWEHALIPKFKYNAEPDNVQPTHYAMLCRMHHSLGDAMSSAMLLKYGIADGNKVRMAVDPLGPSPIPKWKRFLHNLFLVIQGPSILVSVLLNQDKPNLFHGPEMSGPKYPCISPNRFPLSLIQEIRNCSGTSVTTILNACFTGGMRRLFLENGQPVPAQIIAMTTGSMFPYPDYSLQNRFSFVAFPLATGTEAPDERLQACAKCAKDFYSGPGVRAGYYMMRCLGRLPGIFTQIAVQYVHGMLGFTNLPGPTERLTAFGGDPILDIYGFTQLRGKMGISLSSVSYAGKIRFSLLADHAAIHYQTTAEQLLKYVEEELEELAKLYLTPIDHKTHQA